MGGVASNHPPAMQRGCGSHMQLGAMPKQGFHTGQAAKACGPGQGRVANLVLGVDVQAAIQRLTNKAELTMGGGPHQLVAGEGFCEAPRSHVGRVRTGSDAVAIAWVVTLQQHLGVPLLPISCEWR